MEIVYVFAYIQIQLKINIIFTDDTGYIQKGYIYK